MLVFQIVQFGTIFKCIILCRHQLKIKLFRIRLPQIKICRVALLCLVCIPNWTHISPSLSLSLSFPLAFFFFTFAVVLFLWHASKAQTKSHKNYKIWKRLKYLFIGHEYCTNINIIMVDAENFISFTQLSPIKVPLHFILLLKDFILWLIVSMNWKHFVHGIHNMWCKMIHNRHEISVPCEKWKIDADFRMGLIFGVRWLRTMMNAKFVAKFPIMHNNALDKFLCECGHVCLYVNVSFPISYTFIYSIAIHLTRHRAHKFYAISIKNLMDVNTIL